MKATVLMVLAVAISAGSAARILAVFPFPSPSHKQLYQPLMEQLVSRGHQVTIISPFEEAAGGNLTAIRVVFDIYKWRGKMNPSGNAVSEFSDPNTFMRIFYIFAFVNIATDMTLGSPDVARFIHSKDQHFDLVFVVSAIADALLTFGRHFGAPVIAVTTTPGMQWLEEDIGNELPPSYVPNTFLSLDDHMTFRERFVSLLFWGWTKLLHRVYSRPAQDALMRRHFPGVEVPSVLDLHSDVALNFVNILPGVNYPRPLAPNIVPIGGLHILPTRTLPQDMKKFLDESTHGAILFSLGSNLRSADLSKEKREIIIKVLSKLKHRVVWKFERDDLEGLSENVRIWKWLPQNDILAHPNMRAFITHGGLLSSQEAIYHGVPVLVIPFFADQELNAKQAQRAGMGIVLHLSALTEVSFDKALGEITQNPRYHEKAAQMSNIFRDQLEIPLERAVFWTEYVLRHKGAAHLRTASVELMWYQRYLLDVLVVLLLVLAAATCFVLLLCRRLLCEASKRSVSIGKKKNE